MTCEICETSEATEIITMQNVPTYTRLVCEKCAYVAHNVSRPPSMIWRHHIRASVALGQEEAK